MTLHRFCIIAATVCFTLAAFLIVLNPVNMALLGMAFFVLSFYS